MFNINSKAKHDLADVVAELQREVQMRASVYPKLIEGGKMSAEKAQRQFDLMRQASDALAYVHRMAEDIKTGSALLKLVRANPGALAAMADDPFVKQLVEQFPDLKLIAIRDPETKAA